MISKTLILWHGSEETEQSRGAALTFSTDGLVVNVGEMDTPHSRPKDVYYLSNKRGEIVAMITIPEGAHVREVGK